MSRKRLLEAERPEDRAKQRQKLGTLRDLTVQPATKRRYSKATDAFLKFLRDENQTLPHSRQKMDPLVCDYTWNTYGPVVLAAGWPVIPLRDSRTYSRTSKITYREHGVS